MKQASVKLPIPKPTLTAEQLQIPFCDLPMDCTLRWNLEHLRMLTIGDIPDDISSINSFWIKKSKQQDLQRLLKRVASGEINPIEYRKNDPVSSFELKYLRLRDHRVRNLLARGNYIRISDLPVEMCTLAAEKHFGEASLKILQEEIALLRSLGEEGYLQVYAVKNGMLDADALITALKQEAGPRRVGMALKYLVDKLPTTKIATEFNVSNDRIRQASRQVREVFQQAFLYEYSFLDRCISEFISCKQVESLAQKGQIEFIQGEKENVLFFLFLSFAGSRPGMSSRLRCAP